MLVSRFDQEIWYKVDRCCSSAGCYGASCCLIGLELSSSAASTAGLLDEVVDPNNVIVFGVTLGVAIIGSVCFKKFLSVIPILIAVICGYVAAVFCGMIDFTPVMEASFFALPNFAFPKLISMRS